jgi:uncharacterized DUF497 family protein
MSPSTRPLGCFWTLSRLPSRTRIISLNERREITIGHTMKEHLVFVAHCERQGRTRIISARQATRTECEHYEEGIDS